MNNIQLSAVMVTYNEVEYVENVIKKVRPFVDEFVVLDGGSTDGTLDVLRKFTELGPLDGIRLYKYPFRDHYGDQKNMACSFANGRWILLLDPDEEFEDNLLDELRIVIQHAEQDESEVVQIPRKNFIDGVFQSKAYPDYQLRLFRSYCRFVHRVHEELVGWQKGYVWDRHLLHKKTLERQQAQNVNYLRILSKHQDTLKGWLH